MNPMHNPEQMEQVLQAMTGGDAGEEQDLANLEAEEPEGQGLDEEDILNIVGAEMEQAVSGTYSTEIEGNFQDSLDYYLGNPRGDEVDGRSQIISTDVADAIEWILPQIVKALVAKGSVIEFDAVSEEDEGQAEMETVFTHDTFMKENEGFLNLYEFVKDALMQKNGIFKIFYDEKETVKSESYDGLNQQELEALAKEPHVEITGLDEVVDEYLMQERGQQIEQMQQLVQHLIQQGDQQAERGMAQLQQLPPDQLQQATQQAMQVAEQGAQKVMQMQQQIEQMLQMPPAMSFSVTVDVTSVHGKVRVDCVPPEEFRVNQHHDSLSLDDSRFSAHVRLRTKSELLEDGYDPDIIEQATENLSDEYQRDYRFSAQDETVYSDPNYSEDPSQVLLEVAECYMMIDVEKTGIAKLMMVTTIGADDPTDLLEIYPADENPFVSSSCIIMAHKFYGLSIYDRLKQLQDQKTSLWRNILDNLYLQNNREKEVVEGQVNLDDLLVSRPGGIKRVKAPGMIREMAVQPIGQEGYQMLDYLDQVRTGRVGVSPDTAGQIDALGTAVGSEGVARLQTAKEELTGLMVRVIAETGLKQAYVKIRNNLVKYKDNTTAFKFKGEWADVNPSEWGDRSRTTVKVGTGTGDDERKVGAIQQVIAYQSQLMADPRQSLVDQAQLYESLDEFCRVAGLTGASPYFLDPNGTEGKKKKETMEEQGQEEKQKKDQIEQMMVQAQTELGKAEMMKGQASLQAQDAKLQIEQGNMMMENQKQDSDNMKASMQLQLDEAKAQLKALDDRQQLEYDYAKLQMDEALKLTELELKYGLENKKLERAGEPAQGKDSGEEV